MRQLFKRECVQKFAGLLMLAVLAVASSIALAESDNQAVAVNVLDNTTNRTVIQYKFGDFVQGQAYIDGQIFTEVHLGKESLKSEKGMPAVPNVSRSIIIPDDADMSVRVLNSSYYEIKNIDIAPSKGTILRTVNPADVPYTFDKQYKTDAFYPGPLAELREPYILRDQRGIVVTVNPFQYNPVQRVLRVYTSITVEVAEAAKSKINVLKRTGNKHSHAFHSIYKSRFLNYDAAASAATGDAALSYIPPDTEGNMLIICNDAWLPDIQPLVDHKNTIGINTTAVGISTIGNTSTAIKNYIQNVYNTSNLAFVLLVGDAAQVATPTASGGSSDPTYSKLAGSDNYPDIIVGRFSAETAADVDTQVLKTIEYETMPATEQDWFLRGVGIASPEGNATTGDDAESDQQHIEGLRVALLAYNYTLVDQIYEALGPTAADITNALNAGRGIINYCGHGSITAWGTTGFSVTNVNSLTNYNMLPFIFDVACVNGQFNGYTCFAEAWMRATSGGEPTGAAGIYASSINQSWAPPMEAQDKFTSLYIAGTYDAYGALCYNASCSMMDKYGTDGINMFNTWHIFGDPSLRIVGSAVVDNTIAQNPSPADMAVAVDPNVGLSWTPGIYAGSHDVYFGVDYNSVLDANLSSSEYKGNQPLSSNSYNPGILDYNTTYYWSIDEVNGTNIWPGKVWRFTTIPLPPGQAANPSPADSATGVSVTIDLSWTAGNGAASHDVYFGTVNPPPLKGNQAGATYDTGTMANNTTYYWRIDEKNAGGTTTGIVWSFTTIIAVPAKASSPSPATGAINVDITADLGWTAGSGTESHDVYFGTTNPPAYIGNQTGTIYDTGTMANGKTYYWRIDEKNTGGTTTGTVWSFSTIPLPPGQATNPNPANAATNVSLTNDISWTTGSGAASHDVYFGTVNPPAFIGNQTGTTYDTGTMANNTTYYWRIDEKNAGGTTTGVVWSFTTTASSPVAILGSWLTGTTHAKETAGTNRALVFLAHAERNSSGMTLNSVTYGGRAMTKVVEKVISSGTTRTYVAAFILNDAGITAATNTTFVPTWSATPKSYAYSSVFLKNVNQTTLTGATASNATSTGATITTSALATSAGDMVIDAATCSNTGTYTVNNSFTKALELTITNADGVDGYKSATGANETPSVKHSTTNGRQSLIGFVVRCF
jgi:hypothetical protein